MGTEPDPHRGREFGGSKVALDGVFCHSLGPPGTVAGWLKKSLHPAKARMASNRAVRIKLTPRRLGASTRPAR